MKYEIMTLTPSPTFISRQELRQCQEELSLSRREVAGLNHELRRAEEGFLKLRSDLSTEARRAAHLDDDAHRADALVGFAQRELAGTKDQLRRAEGEAAELRDRVHRNELESTDLQNKLRIAQLEIQARGQQMMQLEAESSAMATMYRERLRDMEDRFRAIMNELAASKEMQINLRRELDYASRATLDNGPPAAAAHHPQRQQQQQLLLPPPPPPAPQAAMQHQQHAPRQAPANQHRAQGPNMASAPPHHHMEYPAPAVQPPYQRPAPRQEEPEYTLKRPSELPSRMDGPNLDQQGRPGPPAVQAPGRQPPPAAAQQPPPRAGPPKQPGASDSRPFGTDMTLKVRGGRGLCYHGPRCIFLVNCLFAGWYTKQNHEEDVANPYVSTSSAISSRFRCISGFRLHTKLYLLQRVLRPYPR